MGRTIYPTTEVAVREEEERIKKNLISEKRQFRDGICSKAAYLGVSPSLLTTLETWLYGRLPHGGRICLAQAPEILSKALDLIKERHDQEEKWVADEIRATKLAEFEKLKKELGL